MEQTIYTILTDATSREQDTANTSETQTAGAPWFDGAVVLQNE